jgi:hypothetical protein
MISSSTSTDRSLGLSSRYKGRPDYIESGIDLKDPDAMPVPYNRIMPKKPSAF